MSDYREKCLEAKGKQCTICESTEKIIAHHIDGDRSNNQLENLAPVCESCHQRIHTGATDYEEWFEQLADSSRIYSNSGSIKQEWDQWTVYLPDSYLDDVRDKSKLLDVRLDRDVKMDRHFKPALIALGMERMKEMGDEEIDAFLERMERGEFTE